jgi:hypothetical protein
MIARTVAVWALSAVTAMYLPFCAAEVQPARTPGGPPISALWEEPQDLASRDLFNGPWGAAHAPDPDAVYVFQHPKQGGINPGVIVEDPHGREWHVKQPPEDDQGAEGPVEVVVSRVLSAVGYHQPPVYYLASFRMKNVFGTRRVPGGRFRLTVKGLKARGDWSWQQNPFVGTKPYQGLLAILLLFNSSDIKNENNTLYTWRDGDIVHPWFVVRDLGTALGETGRFGPRRGDPNLFAREPLVSAVRDGYVEFNYRGFHQELVRGRITPDDLRWGCELLAELSDAQWHDAFRAGGYPPDIAARFIATIHARIEEGLHAGAGPAP